MADDLNGFAVQVGADMGALRNVTETSLPLTSDWNTTLSSEVTVYRSGNVITITAWRLAVNSGVTGAVTAYTLPPGFRPLATYDSTVLDSRGKSVRLTVSNNVVITDPSNAVSHHTFTYITLDPPPA